MKGRSSRLIKMLFSNTLLKWKPLKEDRYRVCAQQHKIWASECGVYPSNQILRRFTSGGGLEAGELGSEAAEKNDSQESVALGSPGRISILIVSQET